MRDRDGGGGIGCAERDRTVRGELRTGRGGRGRVVGCLAVGLEEEESVVVVERLALL